MHMLAGMNGPDGTVLVTGGSGYLGGWCIAELLRRGHTVRATLRDPAREAEVREAIAREIEAGERLSFHVADLTSDAGWSEAVAGCSHVLHVASPFPGVQPSDPDELIVPAREGTLRVLRAALAASVERIVVTSSVASVGGRAKPSPTPLDESAWTDLSYEKLTPYARSKTIAEQAAWDFVREQGAEQRLATVEPGAIVGPVLSEDLSFSIGSIKRLLDGMPGLPRIGFSFVDVRDVADLEIKALTAPEAGGERFIAVADFAWLSEIAAALRERLGERASKVPKRELPDILVRIAAVFDSEVRSVVGQLGRRQEYSSAKAREMLGWQPRSARESAVETAESLIERGLVAGD